MRLERTADFLTGHVWKLQIQHHHVGALLSKAFETSDTVRSNLHRKTVSFEQALQGSLHRPAIFDYQYRIHGFLWDRTAKVPSSSCALRLKGSVIIQLRSIQLPFPF